MEEGRTTRRRYYGGHGWETLTSDITKIWSALSSEAVQLRNVKCFPSQSDEVVLR